MNQELYITGKKIIGLGENFPFPAHYFADAIPSSLEKKEIIEEINIDQLSKEKRYYIRYDYHYQTPTGSCMGFGCDINVSIDKIVTNLEKIKAEHPHARYSYELQVDITPMNISSKDANQKAHTKSIVEHLDEIFDRAMIREYIRYGY